MGIGPQNLGAVGMSSKSKPCGTPLKKLEDLSKKKVLVISSSLKKGLSSLLSEVWKRI